MNKTCSKCGETKPRTAFGLSKQTKDGLYGWCKSCRNSTYRAAYAKDRERYATGQRWRQIKHRYGVTKAQWMAKFEEQGGLCAICSSPLSSDLHEVNAKDRTATDHCHETGEFRGLLCGLCNLGIGYLRHDPDLLRAAIAYVGG